MPIKAAPQVAKRTKKPSNNDLPEGIDIKLWRPVFISTYMQYVGSLTNPWEVPVKKACKVMQQLWDELFPNIPYTVTSTSAVYIIVSPLNMLITILIFIGRPRNELRTPGATSSVRLRTPLFRLMSALRKTFVTLTKLVWNLPNMLLTIFVSHSKRPRVTFRWGFSHTHSPLR